MTYRRLIESSCEFIFPFQALLGIGGNVINLMVLLSRPMRSRTNTMLAFAAISDILFLLFCIPNNLSRRKNWIYEECEDVSFAPDDPFTNGTRRSCFTSFAHFFIAYKTQFTFLMNWFSGSSTWLMVAVSFDRLWAIKSPFSARINSCSLREWVTIPSIFVFNLIMTLYINFSFAVVNTDEQNKQKMVATDSTWLIFFTLLNVVFSTIVPMMLLILFNACLLYYLRNRRQFLESAGVRESRKSSEETPPLLEANGRKTTVVSRNGSNNSSKGGWGRQLCKAERHVTVTVAAIVTAYVLTHTPSALLYANMYIFHLNSVFRDTRWYTWVALSSSIVITGKVANFFLFCMSSKHFRVQMKKKICWLTCLGSNMFSHKDSYNPRTRRYRSLPLNQIGDSVSNVPQNSS